MQVDVSLAKAVIVEEVMKQADNSVGPFSDAVCLIDQIIYLPWYSLTADTKEVDFTLYQEVEWARLEGIIGITHVLCKIEGQVKRFINGMW